MSREETLALISRGRTDLVFELLKLPNWQEVADSASLHPLVWFVYYDDVSAIRAMLAAGGSFDDLDIDEQLNSAAFFGHWKVCDFLIGEGADVRHALPSTGETALHSALCKASRPHYLHTVRLLLEHGADPNAATKPDQETGAFMRDVRTKGETPLHRAAAFSDAAIIELLIEHGADREAKDAAGDTPLSWASWHLRPGKILQLLAFPPHNISDKHVEMNTSDHGAGWGNAMERNFVGDYLPLSIRKR